MIYFLFINLVFNSLIYFKVERTNMKTFVAARTIFDYRLDHANFKAFEGFLQSHQHGQSCFCWKPKIGRISL